MGKKLKITESQLKKIIEQSQEQRISFNSDLNGFDNSSTDNNEDGMDNNEDGMDNNDPEQMADIVISKIEEIISPELYDNKDLFDEFMSSLNQKLNQKFGGDSSQYDMPGFGGTTDSLNNLSIRENNKKINESIKKEFKRFIK